MVARHVLPLLVIVTTAWTPTPLVAQSAPSKLEGMWSDPEVTILARFCASWCTDVGVDRLNVLLDNPANDARPLAQLQAEASAYQRDHYIKPRLTPAALETFPLDPADDPGLLKCEPWGLARQIFAPHQIEIRQRGKDRIELHYGEWDARRTVYLDRRGPPANYSPSRLGYSVGRWEGDALVVETAGVAANQTIWRSKHSERLRVIERFTRSADGATLHLTATLEDPWSLREPVVMKRNWRWAPTSRITPYEDCEPPAAVKRGVAQ